MELDGIIHLGFNEVINNEIGNLKLLMELTFNEVTFNGVIQLKSVF